MKFVSILKSPSASVGTAIGTAGLVYAIYGMNVPGMAVIHATEANDHNIESARRKAAVEAAVAVVAVTLITKDINPWILGGGAIIMTDWYVRHANATHPETGQLVSNEAYGNLTAVA